MGKDALASELASTCLPVATHLRFILGFAELELEIGLGAVWGQVSKRVDV
jgi:hypothetical protein